MWLGTPELRRKFGGELSGCMGVSSTRVEAELPALPSLFPLKALSIMFSGRSENLLAREHWHGLGCAERGKKTRFERR